MVRQRLYTTEHFKFFKTRVTDYEKDILGIIGDGELNKQSIIDECNFSKVVVYAAVEALYFAGLLDLKIQGRKNLYSLSDDGIAFAEYLLEQTNIETEVNY